MATASVTGEMLGTPNAKMKELLGKGGPKLLRVDGVTGSGIGGEEKNAVDDPRHGADH